MISGDARRVYPRRERERVKPEPNRITDAFGVQSRRSDRIEVGDNPLGTGRLGNRLDRLCIAHQRINSNLSFTRRSHLDSLTAPTPPEGPPRDTPNLGFSI